MATAHTFTVFGFHSGFDWRPTRFVNGIPSNKVCSACGLVPSKSALLPCRHVLCGTCYDVCGSGRKSCPVENEQFEGEDVVWTNFGKENLLSRKVQCWNARSGCDAVGSVSEILEHFDNQCNHHLVDCLRCHKKILHRDVIKHLSSSDCSSPMNVKGIAKKTIDSDASQVMEMLGQVEHKICSLHLYLQEKVEALFKDNECPKARNACEGVAADSRCCLDEVVKENRGVSLAALSNIQEAVSQLSKKGTTIEQALQQLNEQMKDLKTWWRCSTDEYEEQPAYVNINEETKALLFGPESQQKPEEKGGADGTGPRHIESSLASAKDLNTFRAEVHEKLCLLVTACNAILENTHRASKPLKWSIIGWTKTIKKASQEGRTSVFAGKTKYFYGYSVLPGAEIVKKDDVQFLRFAIQLHKGAYDHLLTWPMAKKLCLKVVHPADAEQTLSISLDTGMHDVPGFHMPTGPKNRSVVFERKILVSDLEEKGFITDDKLNLKLEVFP